MARSTAGLGWNEVQLPSHQTELRLTSIHLTQKNLTWLKRPSSPTPILPSSEHLSRMKTSSPKRSAIALSGRRLLANHVSFICFAGNLIWKWFQFPAEAIRGITTIPWWMERFTWRESSANIFKASDASFSPPRCKGRHQVFYNIN